MKKNLKKNNPKKKNGYFYKILSFSLIMMSVLATSVILYFEVLPLKYLIPLFVIVGLIVIGISYKLNTKTCLFTKLMMSLLSFVFIIIETLGIFYALGTIDFLNNIFDTGYRIEVYNVYVLKDANYTKLRDLEGKKLSIYQQDSENFKKAFTKLNSKISFTEEKTDNVNNAVDQVIKKETEALFLSETLMQIYKEEHEEEYAQLKVIDSVEVLTKSDKSFKTVNVTKNSFVVYLSGSDLEGSIKKVSRSDVNILAIVNPDKGKVLLINTPRDYYVTLASKNAKDKLTHAGIYGIEESALTLGKLYAVDVNYYARVNFTSFIKIIDGLGGIAVDSKYAFSYDGYTFKKGSNNLKGQAALAFSRGRKMLPQGDISRGENQQAVIMGIIRKLSDGSILTKYPSLLNSLESGVMTNIDKATITKLANMQLDNKVKWEIETYNVKGKDSYNVTYSTGSSKVYVMEPDLDTVNEAKLKIQNLMAN